MLAPQMLTDPLFVPQILGRVGPAAMADWLVHLAGLAVFTFLDWVSECVCGQAGVRGARGSLSSGLGAVWPMRRPCP